MKLEVRYCAAAEKWFSKRLPKAISRIDSGEKKRSEVNRKVKRARDTVSDQEAKW